jgi:hypothetical protein
MIETKIELRKLIADEGMTLTDGEIFGKEVYLGKTDFPERWQEIPDAEAEKLQKELEAKAMVESMMENAEVEG